MPVRRLKYEILAPIDAAAADEAFQSGDGRAIGRALLRMALHGPGWEVAELRAVEFTSHPDVQVRRNALTSLGHVVRLTGRLTPSSLRTLHALTSDPEVAGYARDSLGDVDVFMGNPQIDSPPDSPEQS